MNPNGMMPKFARKRKHYEEKRPPPLAISNMVTVPASVVVKEEHISEEWGHMSQPSPKEGKALKAKKENPAQIPNGGEPFNRVYKVGNANRARGRKTAHENPSAKPRPIQIITTRREDDRDSGGGEDQDDAENEDPQPPQHLPSFNNFMDDLLHNSECEKNIPRPTKRVEKYNYYQNSEQPPLYPSKRSQHPRTRGKIKKSSDGARLDSHRVQLLKIIEHMQEEFLDGKSAMDHHHGALDPTKEDDMAQYRAQILFDLDAPSINSGRRDPSRPSRSSRNRLMKILNKKRSQKVKRATPGPARQNNGPGKPFSLEHLPGPLSLEHLPDDGYYLPAVPADLNFGDGYILPEELGDHNGSPISPISFVNESSVNTNDSSAC